MPAEEHAGAEAPPRSPKPVTVERLDQVGAATVRTLVTAAVLPSLSSPHVVVVPGLGALGYLTRLLEHLSELGASSTLLDLPGFGSSRPLACAPTIPALSGLTASWLRQADPSRPIVLVGHSTGAQIALQAACRLRAERAGVEVGGGLARGTGLAGLVLAGPTFTPDQRSWPRVVRAAATAFRRDLPTELRVVRDYLRAGRATITMIRSAMADRPELAIGQLDGPVLLTAGEADSFAPEAWLNTLARAAGPAGRTGPAGAAGPAEPAGPAAEVRILPGSHNNPWTHPDEVARVVLSVPR